MGFPSVAVASALGLETGSVAAMQEDVEEVEGEVAAEPMQTGSAAAALQQAAAEGLELECSERNATGFKGVQRYIRFNVYPQVLTQ